MTVAEFATLRNRERERTSGAQELERQWHPDKAQDPDAATAVRAPRVCLSVAERVPHGDFDKRMAAPEPFFESRTTI